MAKELNARELFREMIIYILPDDVKDDNDVVENYVNAFMGIANHFHKAKMEEKRLWSIDEIVVELESLDAFKEAKHFFNEYN